MPTPKHKAEAAPIRARLRSGRSGVKNCQFSVETILRVNALNCQIDLVLCLLIRFDFADCHKRQFHGRHAISPPRPNPA